jgi:hypothetical protein
MRSNKGRRLERNGKFVDSPLEGTGFELSVPRQMAAVSRPSLVASLPVPIPPQGLHPFATGDREFESSSLHRRVRKLSVPLGDDALVGCSGWGLGGAKGKPGPRNVTGSSQRSPLYAAETPRCLHFGKCACQQAVTRFPPTKERRARPTQMADKIIMRAVEA